MRRRLTGGIQAIPHAPEKPAPTQTAAAPPPHLDVLAAMKFKPPVRGTDAATWRRPSSRHTPWATSKTSLDMWTGPTSRQKQLARMTAPLGPTTAFKLSSVYIRFAGDARLRPDIVVVKSCPSAHHGREGRAGGGPGRDEIGGRLAHEEGQAGHHVVGELLADVARRRDAHGQHELHHGHHVRRRPSGGEALGKDAPGLPNLGATQDELVEEFGEVEREKEHDGVQHVRHVAEDGEDDGSV